MAVTPALADAFLIEGSRRLGGTIRAAGNKNGALPILAACLLADGPVELANVPRIRDVDTMLELRAEMDLGGRLYEIEAPKLHGAKVFLDEASVMATENTVMAAVLARGETVLGNAACEPHVQDLCRFLVSLGAHIEGIESNVLRIHGVTSLRGGEWRIAPDHIEVGSLIGLAAMTSSDVTIEDVNPKDLVSILPGFER